MLNSTLLLIAIWLSGTVADERTAVSPADYKSANFVLHTDLGREDAEELLTKLEAMLKIVSRYWGAPSRKTIECYVVVNSDNWPDDVLPPQAKSQVRQGGITLAQGLRRGRQLDMNAVVYASAEFGTPLHEAVHAYCYQTFGVTGPTWYAEGMAEIGNYWIEGDSSVNCPEYVIEFLKQSAELTTTCPFANVRHPTYQRGNMRASFSCSNPLSGRTSCEFDSGDPAAL